MGVIFSTPTLAADAPLRHLCGRVWLQGDLKLRLGEGERTLLCGSAEGKRQDPWAEPWRNIPLRQARHEAALILQDRGYFHSSLIEWPDGRRILDPGQATRISTLEVEGVVPGLDWSHRRGWIGGLLTPGRLNEIEGAFVEQLKHLGYACATARSEADFESGRVRVVLTAGPALRIFEVQREPEMGVGGRVFSRFEPFQEGDLFDGREMVLASRRAVDSGTILASRYRAHCEPEGVRLFHEVLPGKPRLLTAGFGVDTEGGPVIRGAWLHARQGRAGDRTRVSFLATSRTQSLRGDIAIHPWPELPRGKIEPQAGFQRRNEADFEEVSWSSALKGGRTWDFESLSSEAQTGPSLEIIRTVRGPGREQSRWWSWNAELQGWSRDWEFFRADPRSGARAGLTWSGSWRQLGSDFTAQRWRLEGVGLWNWGGIEPPTFVLGMRGALAVTGVDEGDALSRGIPATLRQYLGGGQSLRGFGRLEIPASGIALSSAFLSGELRLARGRSTGVQPLVFLDLGVLGDAPWKWKLPLFGSPGLGLRWASPVGTLRAALAHGGIWLGGEASGQRTHPQLYLSLGEEF